MLAIVSTDASQSEMLESESSSDTSSTSSMKLNESVLESESAEELESISLSPSVSGR